MHPLLSGWIIAIAIGIPAFAILGLLLFLLLSRFPHKRSLLITLAIMVLFSGDTAKKILASYQHLFLPDDPKYFDATFPLTNVLLSLAVGVLLYFFVLYVAKKLRAIPSDDRDNAPTALLNTLVISVLGLSFFVVISVFITIPYLSEVSKPSVYTQQMLDSTLDKIADQGLVFQAPPVGPAFLAGDSLRPTHTSPDLKKYIDEERVQVNTLIARRANAVGLLIAFSASYKQNEAFVMQKLGRDFGSASQNIRRNKADLFGKAVDGFVLYRKKAMDAYNQALSMLKTADVVDSAEISLFFENMEPETAAAAPLVRDSVIRQLAMINFTPYPDTIAFQSELPVIQGSNRDGSEWGIFGLMSQYLINTESSEMVLLMGMLGFGLLGASLSSFEAAESDRNIFETFRSKPLVKNFGYVLARGCGAAIAVYLCTKAGLAVFTMGSATSTDNASSYMLLLTCFVGSIYSDKVWKTISNSIGIGSSAPAADDGVSAESSPVGGNTNPPSEDNVAPPADAPADALTDAPTDPADAHQRALNDDTHDAALPSPESGA